MLAKTSYILLILLCSSFAWLKYDNSELAIKPYPRLSDTLRLKSDLDILTQTDRSRNYKNLDILNKTAAFIQGDSENDPLSIQRLKAFRRVRLKPKLRVFKTLLYEKRNTHFIFYMLPLVMRFKQQQRNQHPPQTHKPNR